MISSGSRMLDFFNLREGLSDINWTFGAQAKWVDETLVSTPSPLAALCFGALENLVTLKCKARSHDLRTGSWQDLHFRLRNITIVHCYATAEISDIDEKDAFCEQPQIKEVS